ncbi:uncharacterized protein LOC144355197 [Saccoglossus kowalevskii]
MNTTNPRNNCPSAFGSKQAERRILQSGTLNLHALDGTVSQMNALLIPEISANMENYVTSDLLELPHLRDLVLAHPINDKEPNFDIDILIGADYYWQYVTDRVVRGDGPTAVMSPFGYLLSGPKPCGNTSSTTNMLHVLINMPSPIKEIVDEHSIAIPRKVEMNTAPTLYTRESLRPVNEGSSNAAPPAASTHYERRSSQLDNGPSDHETENNNANSASRITNSELHVYNVCETSEHSPSLSDDVITNEKTPTDTVNINNTQLDETLLRFWDLESIGIRDDPVCYDITTDNHEQYKQYCATHLRREGNTFIAKLPWKSDHAPLPTNYLVSCNRTRTMIKRLTPELIQIYDRIIKEQLHADFIEIVTDDDTESGHYLPHHPVKKNSETTPIRIVYDCSSKANGNPSLNDCLMAGPPLLNDLTSILLRFRANPIAYTSDIEKAFLQIQIDPDDRKFIKFLWLSDANNVNSEFITLQFKTNLFGARSSPFILNATVRHLLDESDDDVTVNQLRNDLYVDDVVSGSTTADEAFCFYNNANKLLSTGNFNLRSWSTNCRELGDVARSDNKIQPTQTTGVLGMLWDTEADTLTYKPIFDQKDSAETATINSTSRDPVTKRRVVSETSQLYDPLGLLSPITVKAKLFVQELWKQKLEWDDVISPEMTNRWYEIRDDLQAATGMIYNRKYFETTNNLNKHCELHLFADASSRAYGATAYIKKDNVTSLIMAKNRIAPTNQTTMTIPRLELMALVTATRLSKFVKAALRDKYIIDNITFWSDSQIVLYWLKSDKKLQPFISNRIHEINAAEGTYRYVPTKSNPADLLTRGINFIDLVNNDLWKKGPPWLARNDTWPVTELQLSSINDDVSVNILHSANQPLGELIPPLSIKAISDTLPRHDTDLLMNDADDEPNEPNINLENIIDPTRFSTLQRLLRVTVLIRRFVDKLRRRISTANSPISAEEIAKAEKTWVSDLQQRHFADSFTAIRHNNKRFGVLVRQLRLFIDDDGVLRCGSRLHNADVNFTTKFPALLPSKHYFTTLLVRREHERLHHSGTQLS